MTKLVFDMAQNGIQTLDEDGNPVPVTLEFINDAISVSQSGFLAGETDAGTPYAHLVVDNDYILTTFTLTGGDDVVEQGVPMRLGWLMVAPAALSGTCTVSNGATQIDLLPTTINHKVEYNGIALDGGLVLNGTASDVVQVAWRAK